MSSNLVIKDILHYQKKIQKSLSDDGSDDPKVNKKFSIFYFQFLVALVFKY